MKVLCDINIWIDIASRPKTFPDTIHAFKKLQSASVCIFFPSSGYTTVYYILSKVLSPEVALAFLRQVCEQGFCFIGFGSHEVAIAQKLETSDHEDACIVSEALTANCDYILTRDTKHFKNMPVNFISPSEVLERQW